jgi:cysteine desulfurase/selenocysteine lyase
VKVDVLDLDADFYAFSGHKMYGPAGIGVLYGKRKWLDQMPPYQGGGEMIAQVHFSGSTWNELPYKFEAGTPDFIGSTALAKAIEYVEHLDMDAIARYETDLMHYATDALLQLGDVRIFGTSVHKSAVISFQLGNIHPFDVGTLLDRMGLALRTGHHCAQPLMDRFGIEGTIRASFAVYNVPEEVDVLITALKRIRTMF